MGVSGVLVDVPGSIRRCATVLQPARLSLSAFEAARGFQRVLTESDRPAHVMPIKAESLERRQRSAGFDWSGRWDRLAHLYFSKIVPLSDLVISLHSGGLQQYQTARIIVQEDSVASLDLARALGPAWTILQEGIPVGESTEKAALTLGKPCIIMELGGGSERFHLAFMQNVKTIVESLHNVLRYFKIVDESAMTPQEWLIVEPGHSLHTANGGLIVLATSFELKRQLPSGTVLAHILDLFGREVEVIRAPYDGVVLRFRTSMQCRPDAVRLAVGGHDTILLVSPFSLATPRSFWSLRLSHLT